MRRLKTTMRLDVYLSDSGKVSSRTEAKSFILNGSVTVNGAVVKKPSHDVCESDIISVDTQSKKFVSRGGLKLEGALSAFSLTVEEKKALDVGASSGGFTDCLLQHGAAAVCAVDSGIGQLSPSLLADSRVISIEKFNAKFMTPDKLPFVPQIAVMDVSFISARLIIPSVYLCLDRGGDFICLIKPQFEVGRGGIGKGGIVKDKSLRDKAVKDVVDFAVGCGFSLCGLIESPITGGDGNVEFLAHFRKEVTL